MKFYSTILTTLIIGLFNVLFGQTVTIEVDGGFPTTICKGTMIQLNTTVVPPNPNYTYNWTNSTTGQFLQSGNGDPGSFIILDLEQTATIQVEVFGGQNTAVDTITITVIDPPNPGTEGNLLLCNQNGTIDLFTLLQGNPDAGGIWSPALSGGNGNFVVGVDPPGNYTYTLQGTAPCPDLESRVIVRDCIDVDFDGDGVLNEDDLDDDNDGILDAVENSSCNSASLSETRPVVDIDFGQGNTPTTDPNVLGHTHSAIWPDDGFYNVATSTFFSNSDNFLPYWVTTDTNPIPDVDGDNDINGRYLAINIANNFVDQVLYEVTDIPIQQGTQYNFRIDMAGLCDQDCENVPELDLELIDQSLPAGSAPIFTINSATIGIANDDIWYRLLLNFTANTTSFLTLRIINQQAQGSNGNDLGIDNIRFAPLECDFDLDEVPNYLDLDSDNDGIYDLIEAQGSNLTILDANNDGIIDGGVDANGVPIAANGGLTPINSDGLQMADYLDIDADNDGIQDNIEGQSTAGFIAISGNDANQNGVDDVYDSGANPIIPVDTDTDGTPDYLDLNSDDDCLTDTIEAYDLDQDGVADTIASGTDTDGDGLDNAYDTVVLAELTYITNPSDDNEVPTDFPDNHNPGNDVDFREEFTELIEMVLLDFCQSSTPTVNLFDSLMDTAIPGGNWTGPSALTGGELGTYTIGTNTAGTYIYTLPTINGCPARRGEVTVTSDVTLVDNPNDVEACDSYTLPALTNGNYFTQTNGGGTQLNVGDQITTTQTIFVFSAGAGSCSSAENSFIVTINTQPTADTPANVEACDSYTLPALTNGNYFTQTGGNGTQLNTGDQITTTQTIFVFNPGTGSCNDAENSFVVTINIQPTADAPANVEACDSYTLPALTNGNYFTQTGGNGTQLNAGDQITTTQTIFVFSPGTGSCTDAENSFVVTINIQPTADAPANVEACDSYTLPALTNGNYFTQTGGNGTQLNAGDQITTTQTIFVFTPGTGSCTDAENSFTVTINTQPVVDSPTDVEACNSYTLPALTNGTYFTQTGGNGTQLNAGDQITTTQTVFVFAPGLGSCTDAESSFVITIGTQPAIDTPADVEACDSYTLPALTNGNYFTQTNGGGTQLNVGDQITTTQTIFIYIPATNNCVEAESSFTVTINIQPTADAPANVEACDSYTLPVLTHGNYFTQTGGNGTQLNTGDQITTTQTIFVFNPGTGSCTDAENSFVVTINIQPTVDAPANVEACDSYTLPALTNGTYFTQTGGNGTQLNTGDQITTTQTIFVFNPGTGSCTDAENSFTVTINTQPVADAPTNVEACDSYTLPALTNGNYFTQTGGNGTQLNAGDQISTTQTIFVFTPGTGSCTDAENSFTVTINTQPVVDSPTDVEACNSYTLPALTNGNYFTQTGGNGTQLNAGDQITTTQTVFVFAPGLGSCIDAESSFVITINIQPAIDPQADVEACDSYTLPALTNGTYFSQTGGNGTQLNVGDQITTTQTIFIYIPATNNCTEVESSFTVTINTKPTADAPANVEACDSYTLPALTNGNYFTQTGGNGTQLNTGDQITTTQTIFVFNPGTGSCTDAENSFVVTINIQPTADAPANVEACDSYTLPALTNGNYFTQTGGNGTQLNTGDQITTSQTIFVFNPGTGSCTDAENSFTVTINTQPVADAPTNVEACDSYTLPALTNGNYFTQTGGNGTQLNAGDQISTTQTIFVFTPGTGSCTNAENSFTVTINTQPVVDSPTDVEVCNSYTLPVLTNGNYFTQTSGNGTQLNVGDQITTTQTVFVFAPGLGSCIDAESSFVITINVQAIADAPQDVQSCDSYILPILNSGVYYTQTGGNGTQLNPGDQITTTQTIFVFASGNGSCPDDENSFSVTISESPTAIQPTILMACDEEPNDGFTNFDLTVKDLEITGGNPIAQIFYFESMAAAQTGIPSINPPTNYINTTIGFQTLYVRVQNINNPTCFTITTLDLQVNNTPEIADPITPLFQCDNDEDFIETFDLTSKDDEIENGLVNVTTTYYDELADAEAGTNPIVTPDAFVSGNNEIFAVVENSAGCQTIGSFFLVLGEVPTFELPEDFIVCDIDDDGTENVDLTEQNGQIADGNFALSIRYFETEALAEAGAFMTDIIMPYTVIGGEIVWVRVEDDITGCYGVAPMTIVLVPLPPIFEPDPLVFCDTDNDGFGEFFLTERDDQIKNGDPSGNLVVTYHETQGEANSNTNSLTSPYQNITPFNQIVIARLTDLSTGCFNTVNLELIVGDRPAITMPDDMIICDDSDDDGIQEFNLTVSEAQILDGLTGGPYSVSYYETQANADIEFNPIVNTTMYAIQPSLIEVAPSPDEGFQVIYIVVTDVINGCTSQTSLRIRVDLMPELVQGLEIRTCDTTEFGEQREEFDLTSVDVTMGNTNIAIQYFTSLLDAENNTNPIADPTAFVNELDINGIPINPQNIFIRAENLTSECVTTDTIITVAVDVAPTPTIPEPLVVCDENTDGFTSFNLLDKDAEIIGGEPDVAITYFETLIDAENNTNVIDTSTPYNNIIAFMQTVYARASFTTNSECFAIVPLDLIVSESPVIPLSLDPLVACDDTMSGTATFNLLDQVAEILGDQAPNDYTITFHLFEADAQTGTPQIAAPESFVNTENPQTIWYRLASNNSEDFCFAVGNFIIEVLDGLSITDPTPFTVCDDIGMANDGITTFDLTSKNDEITGGTAGYSVQYFLTQEDADLNTNAIVNTVAHMNVDDLGSAINPQNLFVRVTDSNSSCIGFTILQLRVLSNPVIPDVDFEIALCDDDTTNPGEEVFDITSLETAITQGVALTVGYFETFQDAVDDMNPIPDPTMYSSTTATVYVRITKPTTGCFEIAEVSLIVNPLPDDSAVIVDPLIDCQVDAGTTAIFDLTLKGEEILGPNQDINDYTVIYYQEADDAILMQNGIVPADAYAVDLSVPGNNEIFVGILNNDTGCYIGGAQSFFLEIREGAVANAPALPYNLCDAEGDNDGITVFDLSDPDLLAEILGGQDPTIYSVTFHATFETADVDVVEDEIGPSYTNIINPQIIYVRVENDDTGCYDIAEVILNVEQLPFIALEENYRLCVDENGNPIANAEGEGSPPVLEIVLANPKLYEIEWTLDGTVIEGQTGTSLTAVQGGDYTITITEIATECTASTSTTVTVSSPPFNPVARLIDGAFSGNNTVEITVEGDGDYEYSVDGGEFQESNIFENLQGGSREFTVRDINGCGEITFNFGIIDFPPFFTPNEDGFHDTWQIDAIADFDPTAEIFIFDRFGKLLKQLSVNERWDGTYNGYQLPSSDYWVLLKYTEDDVRKEFRSHFSLKR